MRRGFHGSPGPVGYSIWNPLAPPLVPSALDDEFTGASRDAKWSVWDPAGAQLVLAQPDPNRPGLKMEVATAGAGNAWCGIYQATTPLGTEYTAYTEITPISQQSTGTARMALIVAADLNGAPSTSDFRGVEMGAAGLGAAVWTVVTRLWTAYNAASPAGAPSLQISPSGVFARIRVNGTFCSFEYSTDGKSWNLLNELNLAFSPGHIALAGSVQGAASPNGYGRFSFLRCFSGAGSSGKDATALGRAVAP